MKRRSRYIVFAMFLLVSLTVQTVQADLVSSQHMDNYEPWKTIIGGKADKSMTCKPCHAYWNNISYYDVDSLVINTPARTLNNCVGCHSSSWVTNPNLPNMLASSVHGSLEKKCLSCHTIYHSGHTAFEEETVGGDVYLTCETGCHQMAINPNDTAAGNAPTAGDAAFMRIYAINSTVIPTYKPIPSPTEAFIRKLYNSSIEGPFGEQTRFIYSAYLDPWNKDPSLIASTERYKICFNCHFITTNPAEAAVVSDSSVNRYIPIPEEVFSLIGGAHSIGGLKDYNLDGEDIGVEKRSSDVQITYILPLVTVAIIVLILVSSRRRNN